MAIPKLILDFFQTYWPVENHCSSVSIVTLLLDLHIPLLIHTERPSWVKEPAPSHWPDFIRPDLPQQKTPIGLDHLHILLISHQVTKWNANKECCSSPSSYCGYSSTTSPLLHHWPLTQGSTFKVLHPGDDLHFKEILTWIESQNNVAKTLWSWLVYFCVVVPLGWKSPLRPHL